MDNLGAANGRPTLSLNQQNICNATMAAPAPANYIDLTVDDDANGKSESDDDDDLMELTPAQMQLAMAGKHSRMDVDTLDVSKLNYSFKMMHSKTELLPLRKQFTNINVFLRRLDKFNKTYEFTHAQYRSAWRHAVRMHETEFAINHILKTNPGLDKDGIEAVFTREIQDIADEVYRVNVTTAYERALQEHGKRCRTLQNARQRSDEKKIRSTLSRLVKLESKFGIARDPALSVRGSLPHPSQMAQPAPNNGRKPQKSSDRMVLTGRNSGPKIEMTNPQKKKSSEEQDNINLLPMTFNRLGDRVFKEPTPEREVDDTLGLEAWKARLGMTMNLSSALVQPFAPQMPPEQYLEQDNSRPVLIPSRNYYGVPSNDELLESQDKHMRFYG